MWGRRSQQKFDQLVKQLKDDKFKYVEKDDEEIDWRRYDKAQINEINDMLLMITEAVDVACRRLEFEEVKGPGRPPNSPGDLAKAILMQQYFGVSNRVAEGLVLLFKEKMGFTSTFSYKTIERAYGDPKVTLLLRELFRMSQEPVKDKEHVFSPDGTGLPRSTKLNWENDKGKEYSQKGYEKMVAMIGYKYKLFSAVEITDHPHDHENPYFPSLLQQTLEAYDQVSTITADPAYLSRDNCTLITQADATPRIYPKEEITLNSKGSSGWTEMLLNFIDDPQEWLREYHHRSIVETGFSTLKRDYPKPLRKRLDPRRKQEAFTRACGYNLKRLCYLKYLEDISATEVWNT